MSVTGSSERGVCCIREPRRGGGDRSAAAVVVAFGLQLRRGLVAGQGEVARARILSVRDDIVGSVRLGTKRFTVVYEVHPDGQAPFRARGREVMDSVAQDANPLPEGGWVSVRFNKSRTVVVLERVPTESIEDTVRREEREKRRKEEELLRGPPRS